MSIATLILGESGTGKSTSLRNLDPAHTLLIQAIPKPLPFKSTGWKPVKDGGNIVVTDQAANIIAAMKKTQRDVIVIDDWQYVLANEYMRRTDERGYDKFTDIGRHAWDILRAASELDAAKRVYILAHTQTDERGSTRIKTIGKMLDEKITPEGMFSIVINTVIQNGNYLFSTRNNGANTTKTPMGLFDDELIENDLAEVDAAIYQYYELQPA